MKMKKYLFLILSLFVCQVAMGATAQLNDVATIGGLTFPGSNPAGYFCIHSAGGNAGTGVNPFFKNGASTQYSVPSGTSHGFRVYWRSSLASTVGIGYQFCTTTTAFTFNQSEATTTTNGGLYEYGVGGRPANITVTANVPVSSTELYDFTGAASGTVYPCMDQNNNEVVTACGKEF
jgi:hypothetical protein